MARVKGRRGPNSRILAVGRTSGGHDFEVREFPDGRVKFQLKGGWYFGDIWHNANGKGGPGNWPLTITWTPTLHSRP